MNGIFEENEQWLRDFDKCFNESTKVCEKFSTTFKRFIEQHNITATDFKRKTHIDRNTFRLWKEDIKRPSMKKFVAFCIAYEIDIGIAYDMMKNLEITFILTNKVHYAYYSLIKNFKYCKENENESAKESENNILRQCNKILDKLEIDPVFWLGNDDDKWWDEEE